MKQQPRKINACGSKEELIKILKEELKKEGREGVIYIDFSSEKGWRDPAGWDRPGYFPFDTRGWGTKAIDETLKMLGDLYFDKDTGKRNDRVMGIIIE